VSDGDEIVAPMLKLPAELMFIPTTVMNDSFPQLMLGAQLPNAVTAPLVTPRL
jgi:hypothetical protein